MSDSEKVPLVWDEWPDMLGRPVRAGDYVGIATISGKSPQMVVGQVLKINRVNSRGEPIGVRTWVPNENGTEAKRVYVRERGPIDQHGNYEFFPNATFTVQPMLDGRFKRWGAFNRETRQYDKKVRAVTYFFPQNIIRLDEGEIGELE